MKFNKLELFILLNLADRSSHDHSNKLDSPETLRNSTDNYSQAIMTKEKGKSTKRNSGLGDRLTKLLSDFSISLKEGATLAIGGDGMPTRHSVFHSWCSGATNCTDYKALQSLCRALTARGKEPICFEWLLTGDTSAPSIPTIHNEIDLAKLFLHESDVFDGFVRVKISKVSLKKGSNET